MIPGASQLPFLGGGGGEVPDLTLVLNDVAVDRDRLAAYDHVCGFSLRDSLPATYPHMLAFPLHLQLMTDPSFPFTPIGLVHIYNQITQHRPIAASEPLSLRVWATPAEPHPRGVQFSLHTRGHRRRRARVGGGLDQPPARLRCGRRATARRSRRRRTCRLPPPGSWQATSAAATPRSPAT